MLMVCFINMMKTVSGNTALVLCLFTVYHKFILVWTQIQINFIIFCLRNNNTFMSWDSLMKSNDSNLIWWLEFPKWAFLFETALPPLSLLEIFLANKAITSIPMLPALTKAGRITLTFVNLLLSSIFWYS